MQQKYTILTEPFNAEPEEMDSWYELQQCFAEKSE
jgi:hypothetical protein